MKNFKQRLRHWREDISDSMNSGRWLRLCASVVAIYLVIALLLGMVWSRKPSDFDVIEATIALQHEPQPSLVTGSVTTATTMMLLDTLLNKSGGYISNDAMPPGLWLDNMPNWEYGVVQQVRDMSKALREGFARSQSQSSEDANLARADSRFNFSTESWILPSTESMYKEGYKGLEAYFLSLSDVDNSQAQFFARADNLNLWLDMVSKRLGSTSQRLSASVGQKRVNTDLAGDAAATQSTPSAKDIEVKTPWYEVDDVFFQARGTTWALLHLLKAVEVDFAGVLEKKNATASLQQIIRELELAQQGYYSPVVLNGGGYGMLANHSLIMASYVSRANAGVIELKTLLTQG